jgi:tetratricopeptide (TPR) repeat protein
VAGFPISLSVIPIGNDATVHRLNNRCWSRAVAGEDYDLALADCNKALKINSHDPAALDSRGVVELKTGQLQQAISDFDASLKIGKNPGSLYARGVARLRSGNKSGGDADIVAAKAIDKNIAEKYATFGIGP